MKRLTTKVSGVLAATALAAGLGLAGASPAAADGSKCAEAVTAVGSSSASICWEWVSNGAGSYTVTVHSRLSDNNGSNGRVRLEVNFGSGWSTAAEASADRASGELFHHTYYNKKTIKFQACVGAGNCGTDVS